MALADYLTQQTTGIDYTAEILSELPQGTFTEDGSGGMIARMAEDGTERRLELGGAKPVFFVTFDWDLLSAALQDTLLDWWANATKGRRGANTILWAHPTDGHVYVVRFDFTFKRSFNQLRRQITGVRLRILAWYS